MGEKFKSFITEEKKPYELLIISHDDPLDPNETGPLVRKKASELGIKVYLAEFMGAYMEDDGDGKLFYSYPVDEDGKVQMPDMKNDVKYDKPFRINSENTLIDKLDNLKEIDGTKEHPLFSTNKGGVSFSVVMKDMQTIVEIVLNHGDRFDIHTMTELGSATILDETVETLMNFLHLILLS